MSKQTINIGASPNDGTGTPLRTSFDYTNQNFTELYNALGGGVGLPGATTQVIFNDGGTNLAGDAGLVYNKTTDALTVAGLVTAGSATITGAATVGTTLGVTGASTLASVGVTGAATVGTTLLVGTNATLTNGNVIIGTSGKGIDFAATASGSGTMTSELLNDYEEGTFTATLNGSVFNPTVTQSTTGRYTKVGRQVTVQIFFNNVDTTGASGGIQVIGLPFANNGAVEAISIAGFINMAVFTGSIFGLTLAGSTSIGMYSSQSSGSAAPVTYNAGAVQYLWANLTYTV